MATMTLQHRGHIMRCSISLRRSSPTWANLTEHSAVISAFGREYTKAGKLDAKFHQRLIDAQDLRHTGDYGIEEHVSKKQAATVCEWADEFIAAAEAFLDKGKKRRK